jgi:hypothetical protein
MDSLKMCEYMRRDFENIGTLQILKNDKAKFHTLMAMS